MQLLRNRIFAWAVLVVVAFGTIGISGRGPLLKDRAKAENVYLHGEQNDDLCIAYDLEQAAEAAKSLASVCSAYDLETTLADDALTMLGCTDMSDKYIAFTRLSQSVKDAYTSLEANGLADDELQKAKRYLDEFESRENTISHDPYNEYADAYNQEISAFPANLCALIGGVSELEAFR